MKKIVFLFSLILCIQFSFAQDAWDSVVYNGIYDGNNFRDVKAFNGRLYATGTNSDGINPLLFSSTTGDFGTWTDESAMLSLLPFGLNKVSKLSVYSPTKMFLGTGNNYNSDTVQVYTTDGTTLQQHGHLPISYLVDDYNTGVADFAYFSADGTPDSVFAFVCNDGSIEIFKTSATASNPTWVEVYQSAWPTNKVYDAVVFNNELYAATNGDANGGFILHSADGMVWDTLFYGGNGNSQNVKIKSLEVYNGALYAGTENAGGAQLYRTLNGSAWINVSGSDPVFTSMFYAINDMKVINNRLFLSCDYFNGSIHFEKVIYSNNGNNYNVSSQATDLEGNMLNDPSTYRLESYNGAVYCAGSNDNYGQIWRLKLPVASFTGGTSGTVCDSSPFSFTNTSTNATTFDWSQNNIATATSIDYSGTYSGFGNVLFKLRAYNGNIFDSTSITVNIVPYVSGSVSIAPTQSVCPGEPATITFTQGFGTPPFTYSWTSGSGFPAQGDVSSFTFNPANSGSYSLLVTDANGCTYFDIQSVGMQAPATDIGGTVSYSGGPVPNGNIYLLKYQPTYSGTDTAAIVPIQSNGSYNFPASLYGQYLLKADPDLSITALANTMSTYNGNTFRWDSAVPFLHTCAASSTQNIQLLELPPQNGTAKISGHITEGNGYGMRLLNPGHDHVFAPGGPLKGIDIKLGKNPGGGIQARTMSDSTGYYEFDSVPPGGYKIYVDIPNLPMDSTRELTVNSSTDSIINNDYKADSVMVYIEESPVSIKENKNISGKIKVYPNPANDHFFIEYDMEKQGRVELELIDIVGKTINSSSALQSSKQKVKITTGDLPAGVYFIRLKLEGETETIRVIITR